MGAIFLLGFVLDWLEITLILMPIFAPIVAGLDFGNGLSGDALLVWFGILVAVNLQTSFLTPPFGFSLFYLRGAVGDALTTPEIYRGVLPFIGLQIFVLVLLILFPVLITGLIMKGRKLMRKTMIAAAMAAMTTGAVADEYTLQSAFGGLPVLHPTAERFVANVNALTGGEVEFQLSQGR